MEVEIDTEGVRYLEAELADDVGLLSDGEIKIFVEYEDVLDVAVAKSLIVKFRGIDFYSELFESFLKMGEDDVEIFIVAGEDRDVV